MALFSPPTSFDLPLPRAPLQGGAQALCHALGSGPSLPYRSLSPGVSLGISMFQ